MITYSDEIKQARLNGMFGMTDRELLEMAAKAAGIEILGWQRQPESSADSFDAAICKQPGNKMFWWNPLTVDGDALRLAVKCAAQIHWHVGNVMVVAIDGFKPIDVRESYGADMDIAAATRRAIVRAAAALAP